jgi:hypothetical protein
MLFRRGFRGAEWTVGGAQIAGVGKNEGTETRVVGRIDGGEEEVGDGRFERRRVVRNGGVCGDVRSRSGSIGEWKRRSTRRSAGGKINAWATLVAESTWQEWTVGRAGGRDGRAALDDNKSRKRSRVAGAALGRPLRKGRRADVGKMFWGRRQSQPTRGNFLGTFPAMMGGDQRTGRGPTATLSQYESGSHTTNLRNCGRLAATVHLPVGHSVPLSASTPPAVRSMHVPSSSS